MDYKRLLSIYTLDLENTTEINQIRPALNSVSSKIRHLINKCTLKWFLIWLLLGLAILNSLMPYYRRLISSPFTLQDDTSIFTYPKFTYNGDVNNLTDMLVVVISNEYDYEQRQLIRKHWAHPLNIRYTTKVVFLVGLAENGVKNLEVESHIHRDIISASIIEDYYNLPLKTLSMLLFTDKNFPQVECLIKADSDNFLNISNLEHLCDSFKGTELITGHCENNSAVIRSFRSKWRIPAFVYPDDTYPLYCFGETYMFVGKKTRSKLLSKLGEYGFETSRNRRLMPEDVIFSGFLADMAAIQRQNREGFALQKQKVQFDCSDGQARAYSFHLINEESNFDKAMYYMSKANHFQCNNGTNISK